jgi:hypothetical protein
LGPQMKTVYVFNSGNDRNDGFSPNSAVHSWKRALKLQGGSLNPAQTVSLDSSATETLTLKCGDSAESLSAIDKQVAAK